MYIRSISQNHPFVDGNKRTALASALVFLCLNGYELVEKKPEYLAELVLDFLVKALSEEDLAASLRQIAQRITWNF